MMSPLVEQNGPDTDVLDDSETEELEHVVEAHPSVNDKVHMSFDEREAKRKPGELPDESLTEKELSARWARQKRVKTVSCPGCGPEFEGGARRARQSGMKCMQCNTKCVWFIPEVMPMQRCLMPNCDNEFFIGAGSVETAKLYCSQVHEAAHKLIQEIIKEATPQRQQPSWGWSADRSGAMTPHHTSI